MRKFMIGLLPRSFAIAMPSGCRVNISTGTIVIRADSLSTQSLKCSTSSGSIDIGAVSIKTLDCSTSFGGTEVLFTTNSGKLLTDRAYDRKGSTKAQAVSQSKLQAEISKFSKGELQ